MLCLKGRLRLTEAISQMSGYLLEAQMDKQPVEMLCTVWEWKTFSPCLHDAGRSQVFTDGRLIGVIHIPFFVCASACRPFGRTASCTWLQAPTCSGAEHEPPSHSAHTPRVLSSGRRVKVSWWTVAADRGRLHLRSSGLRRPQRDDWQLKLRLNTTVNQ